VDDIDLVFATEQTFLRWEKEFIHSIEASSIVLPSGGSFLDLEQATELGIPQDLQFSFSGDMPFAEARKAMIDEFWPRRNTYAGEKTPPYDKLYLRTPTVGYVREEQEHKTLDELGFGSGDLVILQRQQYPLGVALGRVHPRKFPTNLEDFFFAVINDLKKSDRLEDWDGEYNPSPVGALLLYTDEDVELATYVRRYYASLHIMSGFDLTFYFLEYIPTGGVRTIRSFWQKNLPEAWYSVWSALGLLRSKPFPSTDVYRFAEELGIQPDRLPCLILFHDWRKIREEKLVVRISDPLPRFFRRSSADVHHAVLAMKGLERTPAPDVGRSPLSRLGFGRVDGHGLPRNFSFGDFTHRLPPWWTADERQYDAQWARASRTVDKPSVFLCHSSKDKAFVERLSLDLRKLGTGIWLDKWEIKVGDSILERIEEGLTNNDFLFIVLSPDAMNSPWVKRELNAATIRELDERRVIVVPILYRHVEIPLLIREKLYADFTASYEDGLKALVTRLFPDALDCLDAINAIKTPPAKDAQ